MIGLTRLEGWGGMGVTIFLSKIDRMKLQQSPIISTQAYHLKEELVLKTNSELVLETYD